MAPSTQRHHKMVDQWESKHLPETSIDQGCVYADRCGLTASQLWFGDSESLTWKPLSVREAEFRITQILYWCVSITLPSFINAKLLIHPFKNSLFILHQAHIRGIAEWYQFMRQTNTFYIWFSLVVFWPDTFKNCFNGKDCCLAVDRKFGNVSFAVVPAILCQLYTL